MAKAEDLEIVFDDGHGAGTAGKRTPDGYRENNFNKKVVNYAVTAAKRCGFKTLLAAPGDADASLKSRTDKANKANADAFVSVHYNAIDDEWRSGEGGIETFHYPGSSTGKRLAQCIHKHIMKGTKLKDRGVKSANFHVLRETKMVAALVECGFMDIKKEAELMKSSAYQKECAEEIVQGLCEYFDVEYVAEKKKKPAPKTDDKNVQGTIKVLVNDLWYYDKPDWNAKAGKVNKNEVFTVVGSLEVDGSKMYMLKSGTYITAWHEYVEFKKK